MLMTTNSTPFDVPFLNVVDPAFDFTAPEVMSAQARSWYADSPIGLLVLRYAESADLLRDRRLYHNGQGYMERNGIFEGPIYDWFVPMIVNRDGSDHLRLRGLVAKAFTPRMIDKLRPFIRAKATSLAEELASVEVCDFVDGFADRLPLAVMCELLGVPTEDYDSFSAWTSDIGLVFSLAQGGEIVERVENAVVGLSGYVDLLIEEKAKDPADDLISALVTAQRVDNVVSEDELRNLLVTLVFAAHDDLCHQFSNGMVTFSEHPEQWNLLERRPELAPQAVEEIIRWRPSATSNFRSAAEDFEYGGLCIEKGAFLHICVQTAQRDPRVFKNGDSFDITVAREAPPIQFGAGPHYCLGSALARAELGEALAVLAARLGPPAIAGPVTWRPSIGIHGPNELPLRFG